MEDKEVVALSLRTQVSNLEAECGRVADLGAAETQREVGRVRAEWERSLRAVLQQLGNSVVVEGGAGEEEAGRLLGRVLAGVAEREKRLREVEGELEVEQQLRESAMVTNQEVAVREEQVRSQRQEIFALKQSLQEQTQQLKSTLTELLETQTKLRAAEKERKTV